MARITIDDVAASCGVGRGTVSRVLNNDTRVRDETRARVLNVMKDLGYRPSAVARGMARRQMGILGIVLPEGFRHSWSAGGGYMAAILDSITERAYELGLDVLLISSYRRSSRTGSSSSLFDGRCDGVILLGLTADDPLPPAFRREAVPFVLIDDTWDEPWCSCVTIDDRAAGRTITSHLLDEGHVRIAFLGMEPGARWSESRRQGMQDALVARGLPVGEYVGMDWANVLLKLNDLLARPVNQRPTALLCETDHCASMALAVCRSCGVRVPADISVAGFNDTSQAITSEPPLTTVRQPLDRMGRRAVDILQALVNKEQAPGCSEIFPFEVIARESTGSRPR
jgi:LacI family transcriptional regulator